jgi:hypothetical protein
MLSLLVGPFVPLQLESYLQILVPTAVETVGLAKCYRILDPSAKAVDLKKQNLEYLAYLAFHH